VNNFREKMMKEEKMNAEEKPVPASVNNETLTQEKPSASSTYP
jgi:hypothetical protein